MVTGAGSRTKIPNFRDQDRRTLRKLEIDYLPSELAGIDRMSDHFFKREIRLQLTPFGHKSTQRPCNRVARNSFAD